MISPRKLPDEGDGVYPKGAVFDVFSGEVRQADIPNIHLNDASSSAEDDQPDIFSFFFYFPR